MNIGIFSGSFNPVHIGHLILANYITEYTDIEEVWFLVTPQNPLKDMADMLDENLRYEMVQLAIENYSNLKASDFEFALPRPSYTVNTLSALQKKYPGHTFSLIIGSDNWVNFKNWKEYRTIIDNHKIYVYPRLHSDTVIEEEYRKQVILLDSPIVGISSSFIRKGLSQGKDLRAFLPQKVNGYIEKNDLYR